ncbi:hypothetical protein EI94DRAFT_663445 [Lactarius quietus]|nr:hypothetical protein EI94DRAFT_663445 [Lactarius quietus]
MANYRKRGPPSVSSVASSISSRAPSTAGSSNAWSSRGAPPPPAPPGLDSRLTSQSRTSDRFDWSEDVERFEAEQMNNPPIRSQAPSVSSAPARRPPYDPDGPVEPSRNYEYTEEDKPRHSTVAAMSDIFDDDVPPPATPSVRSGRGGTQPPGLNDPDYDPWNPPAEAADFADDQPEACDSEAPWVNYAEPRLEPPTKIKKKGQWTCSQHGSLCSPGICKERAKHECDERMQKEREKWDEEKRQRDAARAKKHKKREKKEADAEAMGQGGRARPPHFGRGNTSSGNNSSSNNNNRSGADSDTSRDRDPPDQEDWSTQIPWESRDVDAQSVVSSARPAWDNGDDVSDDDDYDHDNNDDDGASVAESRTSSVASHSSRPPAPANVWGNNNSKPGPPQISPTSPRPASRQSAWDARSSASVPENVWPSVSGFSRAGSVTGSDSGPRSGTRPPTTADSRSSVSSGVRAPITFSAVPSGPKGFPTHADTEWGDPIAKAMAAAAKDKSEEGSGSEEGDGDGAEEKSTKSTKKKKKKQTKKARAPVLAKVSTVDAVLEEIPAGGPGSSWGNPDEPW